jgi:hypothetical protein
VLFQGDMMVERVEALPEGLAATNTDIVAHSETGHHHVATKAKVYAAPDGMTLYLQAIGSEIDLVHKRSFDQHETIQLRCEPGDVFRVRRQREYTPEGWRRVED